MIRKSFIFYEFVMGRAHLQRMTISEFFRMVYVMRKKKNHICIACAAAIFALVLTGAFHLSCKSGKTRVLSYKPDKNPYYTDLIPAIFSRGKIASRPIENHVIGQNPGRRKNIVITQNIFPLEMIQELHNGELSIGIALPKGRNRIVVKTRGKHSDRRPGKIQVDLGDLHLGTMDVLPGKKRYAFTGRFKRGQYQLKVSFSNNEKGDLESIRVKRAVLDHSEYLKKFIRVRRFDDTLNDQGGSPFLIMGKIGSEGRRSLFLPPQALAETEVVLQKNAFLLFSAGVDEYVRKNKASACQLKVIFSENGEENVLYEGQFKYGRKGGKRNWHDVELDLSEFGSRKGKIRFEVQEISSKEQGNGRRVRLPFFLLANPRIVSRNPQAKPNVILISLDTLRQDHLSIYGYKRETSPFIDEFAQEAVVFDRAIAQAPYTVTSHMSMMTALWPSIHGVLTHEGQDRLSTQWLSLAQILKAKGYMTAGFTGGAQVSAVYGFDRGMDVYDYEGGRSGDIFPKAMKWISQTRGNPFFVFLHTYDVHIPYAPPSPFDKIFNPGYEGPISEWREGNVEVTDPELFQRIIDLYDGEIRYADSQVQSVIQHLREEGFYDNALIIVTSDHGEEFMERGKMAYHWYTLYNELLSVPLIIKFPGNKGAGSRIQGQVGLIDLMPTVLDHLGVSYPPHISGVSLLKEIKTQNKKLSHRRIFSERSVDKTQGKLEIAVQTSRKKYYWRQGQPDEYFNLENDPDERYNLLQKEEKSAAILKKEMVEYIRRSEEMAKLGKKLHRELLDEATEKRLKALGYVK